MITIKKLREAVAEIISEIPGIRSIKEVSNDDRFVDKLEKHKNTDNALLIIVVPVYNGFGTQDNGGFLTNFQFFILDKIDYKTTSPEETQEKLQPVIQDFLQKLFAYSQNSCMLFNNIDRESIDIIPITNKANCAGWEIQATDKSYTGYDGRIEQI